MRRRRQQKLERKLQQFRSKDGGPDTGGTLKIYGEALCKDVPYKTLLLSVRDSAAQVVREMLAKYGLDKVDPQQYCLVQVSSFDPHCSSSSNNIEKSRFLCNLNFVPAACFYRRKKKSIFFPISSFLFLDVSKQPSIMQFIIINLNITLPRTMSAASTNSSRYYLEVDASSTRKVLSPFRMTFALETWNLYLGNS